MVSSSITFLGTGGDATVIGRHLRSSGGFVVTYGDNQFHIDPGTGALVKAFEHGINPRATTALLVSHAHINHSNDTNAMISAMSYGGFDKKGVLIANRTVIEGTQEILPCITKYHRECLERVVMLDEGQRVGINEIEIIALKARHSEPNTIGFKILTPEFTIAYSSDTKFFQEMAEEYKNSSIIILNVVSPIRNNSRHNLCSEDAVQIIKSTKPQLAIIQHFGIEMIKSDPLYIIREMQKQTGVHIIAAKDGMCINPLSHSADRGQKTLRAYPVKPIQEVKVKEIENIGSIA